MDYERPFDATIDLFIWRIRGSAPDGEKKGNIWFIQGGPGESSVAFSIYLPFLAAAYPDWNYYSMDHRGVGNSNRLECPTAVPDGEITPNNAAACYDEVQAVLNGNLASYNVTNAAKDLHKLIDLTQDSGKNFVYGVSYGTYLVQRFMTMYPNKVDGIILDSIVPADSKPMDTYDSNFNNEGKQIMDHCLDDVNCRSRISEIDSDPWIAMGMIFDMIDDESLCSNFSSITRKDLRNKLASLASNAYQRAFIPAVIYRIYRCNESDKTAISHLFPNLSGSLEKVEQFQSIDSLSSSVLRENIIISELYGGISPVDAQDIVNTAYVSEDLMPDIAGIGYNDLWPPYYDILTGRTPQYTGPVLMINSSVDGSTPLSSSIKTTEYLNNQNQYFITIPWAAHGAVFESPVQGRLTPIEERVGVEIMMDFISDPLTEPDRAVLDTCYIPEFDASSVENTFMSEILFGSSDMWD